MISGAARQMRTMSNLGDITKFADVGLLTGENPDSVSRHHINTLYSSINICSMARDEMES